MAPTQTLPTTTEEYNAWSVAGVDPAEIFLILSNITTNNPDTHLLDAPAAKDPCGTCHGRGLRWTRRDRRNVETSCVTCRGEGEL